MTRPQRKAHRPAYARRTSWACPNCGRKNTVRSSRCGGCAWIKNGLNRKPSSKDALRLRLGEDEYRRRFGVSMGEIEEKEDAE